LMNTVRRKTSFAGEDSWLETMMAWVGTSHEVGRVRTGWKGCWARKEKRKKEGGVGRPEKTTQ
jgi:hypothetical protein